MVAKRFGVDGGFDFGQQAAGVAVPARFGCRTVLDPGPASRLPGAWTFRDHCSVGAVGLFKQ